MDEKTLETLTDMIMIQEAFITGADAQDEINNLWEVYELAYDKVHKTGVFKDD